MFDSLIRFVRDQYRTDEFIPLHAPVFRGRERELVLDTINSTFVSSVGAYVDRFEMDMAAFTNSQRAVAVMNGTAALHISLKLIDVAPGDLVVTQSLTFVATCNAITYCGAEPLFVDVDRHTLGLSPTALDAWLSEHALIDDHGDCRTRIGHRRIRACLPMHILLALAEKMVRRVDVGFLFVGRGTEAARLKAKAQSMKLENVVFFDEVEPDEIPDLYAQCDAGIVALDTRHKSHNIPGKFLTYMQSGLPVLANVNPGNDLAQMIRTERVGHVCEVNQVSALLLLTEKLLDQIEMDSGLSARCTALFEREFAVAKSVKQIVAALSKTNTVQP